MYYTRYLHCTYWLNSQWYIPCVYPNVSRKSGTNTITIDQDTMKKLFHLRF